MTVREWVARPYRRIRHSLAYFRDETSLAEFVPRGHYYSPLPAIEDAAAFSERISRRSPHEPLPGIDLNGEAQRERLARIRSDEATFDWPAEPRADRRFYTNQGFFNIADALTLYSIMTWARPRRIVEIGSGFSSALMLDTRDMSLDAGVALEFVEPYPDRLARLLRPSDAATTALHRARMQDLPIDLFTRLEANDILFVDSSHVSRAGSDVNFILFEILPRLKPGVLVHVHDVFWPFEYPARWFRRGMAWNEAYLLRAFLTCNDSFEIYFWAPYAARLDPSPATAVRLEDGQSIWIRRRADGG